MAERLTKWNDSEAAVLGHFDHPRGFFPTVGPFLMVHSQNVQRVRIFPFDDEPLNVSPVSKESTKVDPKLELWPSSFQVNVHKLAKAFRGSR